MFLSSRTHTAIGVIKLLPQTLRTAFERLGQSIDLELEAELEPIEKPGFTGTIERTFTWTFDVTSGRLVSLTMTQESNGISPIQQGDVQVNQITTVELGPLAQG